MADGGGLGDGSLSGCMSDRESCLVRDKRPSGWDGECSEATVVC
jgi:hypothetical protein